MALSIERFEEFFEALYGYGPFPWQSRLARLVYDNNWPACIDLPTASGKTATIDIAVFVLACQADRSPARGGVGRRIFFTVNRRVIVDEAFERAKSLAKRLYRPDSDILKQVAAALRSLNEDNEAPPLDVAELRGGIYRERRWARSLTQPTVICTTVDQLGSRLLFRGYGVSPQMQSVHAALCACDSLIMLDEAHITRAFSQTLDLVRRYRECYEPDAPPLRFVEMTATPSRSGERFTLGEADLVHPILKKRLNAAKPAELVSLGKVTPSKLVDKLVAQAISSLTEQRKAIGVMVNRVQTAREVFDQLHTKYPNQCHLVIGRMRLMDRNRLQDQLRSIVGSDRPDADVLPGDPCFVVATQTLEVGADYDFDALITECASIDALRQRFGRLNRKGRGIEAVAAIVTTDAALKDDDPIYGEALKNTWEWMTEDGRPSIDFGILAFKPLWEQVEREHKTYLDPGCPKPLLASAPDAAVLLPVHLDTLCQTAPQPEPSPDVSYFIHGPGRDNAEVQVCWRADLGEDDTRWAEIVRLLPPTVLECMTVPIQAVRSWMRDQSVDVGADIPVTSADDETKDWRSRQAEGSTRRVLVWRGLRDIDPTADADLLRPGDTIVIPAKAQNWNLLGHIPDDAALDCAEDATRETQRRVVVRLHAAFDRSDRLRDHATDEAKRLTRQQVRDELISLGVIPDKWRSGPQEHTYPLGYDEKPSGLVLVFNQLLPEKYVFEPVELDSDPAAEAPSPAAEPIPLDRHVRAVARRAATCMEKNGLNLVQPVVIRAAELHDAGKADVRFQALLLGGTPYEAMECPTLLAKSEPKLLTQTERTQARERALLPPGFRHEMLSVLLAEQPGMIDEGLDRDLVLHLIAAHHGHARPFAPVVVEEAADDELLEVQVNGLLLSADRRRKAIPAHRLDSGIADRFWSLTRQHGWWGLAYLESILRLADQQISAAEAEGNYGRS